MHDRWDLPSIDICEEFQELYYEIGYKTGSGFSNGMSSEAIENHPKWKKLERLFGLRFTTNDLANYGYLYYK